MRNCPICGSQPGEVVFPYLKIWNNKRFNYYECISCGSTFVDPLPDVSDFEQMYSKSEYHDVHYHTVNLTPAHRSIARILPYVNHGSSMLDFGCGIGNFLRAAKEAGFVCTGVEYEKSAREAASRSTGCPVLSLEEVVSRGSKYDVIHLGDVLEHLPDPAAMIVQLKALLTPGGIFYVEGPLETNPSIVRWSVLFFNWIKRLVCENSLGTTAPTHLFMTNAKSQQYFFTINLGYRCIYYYSYETGWPYLNTEKSDNITLTRFIKGIIGRLAVVASRFFPILSNRFIGLFQP